MTEYIIETEKGFVNLDFSCSISFVQDKEAATTFSSPDALTMVTELWDLTNPTVIKVED